MPLRTDIAKEINHRNYKNCAATDQAWSRRQESNLYLPLRRRPFYPLNYGERAARILACSGPGYSAGRGLHHCQRHVQIRSSELSNPDCARSVKRRAMR